MAKATVMNFVETVMKRLAMMILHSIAWCRVILASLFITAPPYRNLKTHTSPQNMNGSVRNWTLLRSVCPAEHTMTGVLCLTEWLLPELVQDRKIFTLQQEGAPTHFHVQALLVVNDSLVQPLMTILSGCDGRRGNPTSPPRIILFVHTWNTTRASALSRYLA